MTILVAILLLFVPPIVLALVCYRVVRRARSQRRPTPLRPVITPSMQQKMARSLTTLITSGGMREFHQAQKMAKQFKLRKGHFEALAVPPEEDFARDNLIKAFR